MLLGVPSVAADVGGVRNLMTHGTEGFIYKPGQVTELAAQIMQLFALEERGEEMGENARNHAMKTHDPEANLRELIKIYDKIR